MIPCIYNLVSILTLFEIHIEGLTGIFYFYFTYFCLSISTCINKKINNISLFIISNYSL